MQRQVHCSANDASPAGGARDHLELKLRQSATAAESYFALRWRVHMQVPVTAALTAEEQRIFAPEQLMLNNQAPRVTTMDELNELLKLSMQR
eukprot:6925-Heterococcus_DN1.PRE.1